MLLLVMRHVRRLAGNINRDLFVLNYVSTGPMFRRWFQVVTLKSVVVQLKKIYYIVKRMETPNVVTAGNAFKCAMQFAEKGQFTTVKENYPGIYLRYKKTLESF